MSIGRPISDSDRRKRSLKHLLLYGIKMMVRKDIGGRDDIANHASIISKKITGMTAIEAGQYFSDEMDKFRAGIADRQKRTIAEMERRLERVIAARNVVSEVMDERGVSELLGAIDDFIDGEGDDSQCDDFILK